VGTLFAVLHPFRVRRTRRCDRTLELDRDIGLIEYGHPSLERMLANRRFGFTIGRSDALRSSRPSRRLRAAVGDSEWIALLESIAFTRVEVTPVDVTFSDGAGI
jgi:hypothetical protein